MSEPLPPEFAEWVKSLLAVTRNVLAMVDAGQIKLDADEVERLRQTEAEMAALLARSDS